MDKIKDQILNETLMMLIAFLEIGQILMLAGGLCTSSLIG